MNYKSSILKISHLLIFGLLVSTFTSCDEEFLDNTDKTNLNDETQWESESTADLFLNDIYSNIPNKGNEPENLDNFTDDNDAGFYYTSYNWKSGIVNPSSSDFQVWGGTSGPTDHANWESTYAKVRRCNLFIQKINENAENFSESYIKQRIDEARFLRAYFYSELWLHVGGIPIITEPLDRNTMEREDIYNARNTFAETLNFLTDELGAIVQNQALEVKYSFGESDAGRATLGAALMLKGWLELYAASPLFNSAPALADPNHLISFESEDPSRWATAAATNKKFIDEYGGTYALFPELSDLWRASNEYNSEVIWDRQVVANTMGSNYEQYGGPVWVNGVYYTWGNYNPTQEMVDDFAMANGKVISDPTSGYNPQDPYTGREKRFYDFIVYDGAPYKLDWMETTDTIYTRIDEVNPSLNEIDFGSDDVGNTGYYSKKKLNPDAPRGGGASGQNYIFYRYAMVLLNYAEAQNEVSGPDASVYSAINALRNRSELPDLEAGLDKNAMREAIHRERRVELGYENNRFFDIIRWKIAEDVMSVDKHGMKITNTSPSNNSGDWQYEVIPLNHPHVFTSKMYMNPIPQSIIDQNPEILQNPGY
ncbi:RagB/SusD family nutrient uptake outer membrane protein [Flavimarina sp. Hel_I_48]|uniref:RagB/SusD family nutrient uptake outer membrane protein n=1 Tax=Flavimarina sp. Hel_I_48 TaxID=1392488 RepID=UPI0004DF3548|nr:RagB/SusD family nutrient uptake outer membrane protein [Flavimarina sp. Hel_I_48]